MAQLKSGTRIHGNATVDGKLQVGAGITIDGNSGIISATGYRGDGSQLSGVVAGAQLSVVGGTNPVKLVLTNQTGGSLTNAQVGIATYIPARNEIVSNLVGNVIGVSTYAAEWIVTEGVNQWNFTGPGVASTMNNPNIYLVRGQKYRFISRSIVGSGFRIAGTPGPSLIGAAYNIGVTNQNAGNGAILEFDVSVQAPPRLYYTSTSNSVAYGNIYIVDPSAAVSASSLVNNGNRITTGTNGQASFFLGSDARIYMEALYATAFGGQPTTTGYWNIKLYGTNLIFGDINAGSSINRDSWWGMNNNVVLGYLAAQVTTGSNSTIIGASSGDLLSGNQNTCLGTSTGSTGGNGGPGTNDNGNNCTIIGYNAKKTSGSNNEITLGNSSIASLRCQVTSITALSDRRDKTNIEDVPVGLDYINSLRPVKFDWNRRDGSYQGEKAFGFIAQELEEVQNKFGYREYTKLVYDPEPDKLEATPLNTYPILIKAVQELSQQNKELLQRIENLEKKLNDLTS